MVVPDVEWEQDGVIKVSIDYMYLHERVGKYRNVEYNPPQLVMVNHNNGRVWAYRVPNKGVMDDAAWLPKRIVQDISNCGNETTPMQLVFVSCRKRSAFVQSGELDHSDQLFTLCFMGLAKPL